MYLLIGYLTKYSEDIFVRCYDTSSKNFFQMKDKNEKNLSINSISFKKYSDVTSVKKKTFPKSMSLL